MRKLAYLLLCSAVLSLLTAAAPQDAASHPCQRFTASELPPDYGTAGYGIDPAASINDITFLRTLPDPASLSHAERYMIAGLTTRPRGGGRMDSWHADLFTLLHPYLYDGNPVPERLTDEIFTYVFGQVVPENWMPSFLKSPIHGAYPRLNAREFSAGDVYIRPLSDVELRHVADYDALLRVALKEDGSHMLIGPVVYLRIYGHTEVIANTLSYILVQRRDQAKRSG